MMDARATPVNEARAEPLDERALVLVDGMPLRTPAGLPVEPDTLDLAQAMVAELEADGSADVTAPSLYAFYSTQRDFIDPNPARTVDALVELLDHDYLLHPESHPAKRQAQLTAWRAQIDLWQQVAGREPPYAPPRGEPAIPDAAYRAFRAFLNAFTPAQLSVAIQAANLVKSASLGMLLAQQAIDEDTALGAAAISLRLIAGDTQAELELQEEREDELRQIIGRLLRYAALS